MILKAVHNALRKVKISLTIALIVFSEAKKMENNVINQLQISRRFTNQNTKFKECPELEIIEHHQFQ